MPKVYNKRNNDAPLGAIYCGRGGPWGNPFVIGKDGSRTEVINKYRNWINTQPALIFAAKCDLVGRDLICWCAPYACHADVLMEIAND